MMNDKIRELAEQAGFYYTPKTGFITPAGCDPAKFAEHIISECIGIIDREEYRYDADPHWEMKRAIKRHFGVE